MGGVTQFTSSERYLMVLRDDILKNPIHGRKRVKGVTGGAFGRYFSIT